MPGPLQSPAVHIGMAGSTTTSSGTSQAVAIPSASASRKPRYVRITATGYAYVKCGTADTVTATANDIMVNGQGDGLILAVGGYSHIAILQETSAAKVNIVPLED